MYGERGLKIASSVHLKYKDLDFKISFSLFGIWYLPSEPFSVLDAVNVYSAVG
jgi:hypothetical protein